MDFVWIECSGMALGKKLDGQLSNPCKGNVDALEPQVEPFPWRRLF